MWAEDLAYEAATKRLLRELRYLLGGLDVLAPTAPTMALALESMEPALLGGVRATAAALCGMYGLSAQALTAAAAGALCHTSAGGSRRLSALCLLLHALDRPVAADAAVCAAAGRLVQCCSVHGEAQLEDLSLKAAQEVASGTDDAGRQADAASATASEPRKDSVASLSGASRAESYGQVTGLMHSSTALQPLSMVKSEGQGKEEPRRLVWGLGADSLVPHLSELRSAAFQLEVCLSLHARGCLRLSARAQVQATMGFKAGLLVEALGRR